jgi:hypothetical protein
MVAVTFERRPLRVAAHVFWALLVGYSAFGRITGGWKAYRRPIGTHSGPPAYGLYDKESGAPPN